MSYVHDDDAHEGGRITEIRGRLSSEVKFQTGKDFPIFQDIQDIFVGENWRRTIHGSIDGSTFLLAIITPSFLQSSACRDEVKSFLQREATLNRDDLIIPILYSDAPGLHDSSDEIATELAARQYDDWRELRFVGLDSPAIREKLATLAAQISASFERTATHPVSISAVDAGVPDEFGGDSPGFIELVAAAEEAMPQFAESVAVYAAALEDASQKMGEITAEIEAAVARGKGSAARLTGARRLASALEGPTAEMEEASQTYVEQLTRVDGGLRALIERVPELQDEEDIAAARELLEQLPRLEAAVSEGMDGIAGFQNAIREAGQLSSTLRPIFRRMFASSQQLLDSRDVFTEWKEGLRGALAQLDHQ